MCRIAKTWAELYGIVKCPKMSKQQSEEFWKGSFTRYSDMSKEERDRYDLLEKRAVCKSQIAEIEKKLAILGVTKVFDV